MKIWVGVTDKNWFDHLTRLGPDEVNFWQPSGSRTFKVLQPGEPFLFKLRNIHLINFISVLLSAAGVFGLGCFSKQKWGCLARRAS